MKPIITIITPCYNAVQFIESCIKNVIDQKCEFAEHIIMDGGSKDGTLDIIKKYADKYPHIKFISEPDKGQSDAMNNGIKTAKGEVISFLNADDGYFVFVLNRIVKLFQSNSNLNFIAGNCKLFDLQGNLLYINRPQRLKVYHLFSSLEPYPINPASYFYKKALHDQIGYYNVDNHFNMDLEFLLKMSSLINMVYFNEDWGFMIEHELAKSSIDNKLESRKVELIKKCFYNLTLSQKLSISMYKIFKLIKNA